MYKINTRYEHWSSEGKCWTKWFSSRFFNTKEEAEAKLNASKELSTSIDKVTKLKHQYEIVEVSKEEIEAQEKYLKERQEKTEKKSTKKGKRN